MILKCSPRWKPRPQSLQAPPRIPQSSTALGVPSLWLRLPCHQTYPLRSLLASAGVTLESQREAEHWLIIVDATELGFQVSVKSARPVALAATSAPFVGTDPRAHPPLCCFLLLTSRRCPIGCAPSPAGCHLTTPHQAPSVRTARRASASASSYLNTSVAFDVILCSLKTCVVKLR